MNLKLSLLVGLFVPAIGHGAFMKFGDGFNIQKGTETVIKNMPPVTSQDSMGLCYSHTVATIMNAENCRIMKTDCTKLSAKDSFSTLDIARFGQAPDGEVDYESSYRGIKDGGPTAFTLQIAALFVGNSASEECLSLDKVLAKLEGAGGTATEAQVAAFKRLKKAYDKFKGISKDCEKCLTDFFASFREENEQNFDIKKDNATLLKNFSEDSYEKFFDRFVYPKECARAKNRAYFEGRDKMDLGLFPHGKEKANYKNTVSKIKEVLKKGHPMALGGICLDEKVTRNCANEHAAVISGFRRVCDEANNCYDALKIQNSWGEGWQQSMNGGWVEAKALLDATRYQTEMLSWLEDKPKTQQ